MASSKRVHTLSITSDQKVESKSLVNEKITQFLIDKERLLLDVKSISKSLLETDVTYLELLRSEKTNVELGVYDSHANIPNPPSNVIVMLHGLSSSSNVFIKSNIVKSYEGSRVIAIDFLGHGESTNLSRIKNLTSEEKLILAENLYTPHVFAAMVKQVLNRKNITCAQFIAWSIGGLVAFLLGDRVPTLVSSITTIATPPIRYSLLTADLNREDDRTEGYIDFSYKKIDPDKKKSIAIHNGIPDIDGENAFFWHDTIKMDPLMMKFFDHSSKKIDVLDAKGYVKSARIPFLLIGIEDDGGINYKFIESFSGKMQHPLSRVCIIKKGKHAFFVANPEKLLEETLPFNHTVCYVLKSSFSTAASVFSKSHAKVATTSSSGTTKQPMMLRSNV